MKKYLVISLVLFVLLLATSCQNSQKKPEGFIGQLRQGYAEASSESLRQEVWGDGVVVNEKRATPKCLWYACVSANGQWQIAFSSAICENVFKHLPDRYHGQNCQRLVVDGQTIYQNGESFAVISIGPEDPITALNQLVKENNIVSFNVQSPPPVKR